MNISKRRKKACVLTLTVHYFLPKLEDKQIKILNEPENFYFYNNSRINVLSNNYLRNCHGYGNYSLCGVLAPEDIEVPNACVKSIIAGNEDKSCSHINLNFHNYMVYLSSNKIFYSIVYPISIRVDCNNKTTIYNLTESRGVDYSNQCEIHRVINKIQYDMNSLTTYERDEPMHRPNFTVYDSKNNNWTGDFHLIENNIKLIKLAIDNEENHKIIKSRGKGFWHKVYSPVAEAVSSAWNYIHNNILLMGFCYTITSSLISLLGYVVIAKIKNVSFQK